MTRLIALLIAVVFAGAMLVAPDATAQASKTDKAPAKSATTDKAGTEKKETAKSGKKLDLNAATEAELKELPGIGDAYAKKIVDNRPYKRKDEIVKKAGVPKATYDKIKDEIIAHQVKEDAKSSPSASTGTKKK